MIEIRHFQNADLPALADVWLQHWSAAGYAPSVSIAVIEQAILSRTFFDADSLLVAQEDDTVIAWCQYLTDPNSPKTADLCAICFTHDKGTAVCDRLLQETESRMRSDGITHVVAGPARDRVLGYAGLPPIGHGIGIPVADARTSSLLSRNGYSVHSSFSRMTVPTNPYRAPVNRESLQLRRATRLECYRYIPNQPGESSAMSHFDIELHVLVNHRSGSRLATVELWCSDPEAQVMSSAESILSIGEAHARGHLESAESYLVASVIQSLANRRIFSVETAVDNQKSQLVSQLETLQFKAAELGQRWQKTFT